MAQPAFYNSPLGILSITCEDNRITEIKICSATSSISSTSPLSDLANKQIQEYLNGKRTGFNIPICPKGTPFQLAVWKALMDIPYGQTQTYGQIAVTIGKPRASRAVGMACNKNPLWIVIPCHRVVGKNQALVGYAGGLDKKEALLQLEQQNKLPRT